MTLTEYIAQLRLDLNDVPADGDDGRWSDAELTSYLKTAASTYSQDFPRERLVTLTMDGESNLADSPADLIDEAIHGIRLITPNGYQVIPRVEIRNRGSNRHWEKVADTIRFGYTPPAGTQFEVHYDALHAMPDAGSSTIPTEDDELIFIYAQYLAWRRVGGNDAALSRWKEEGKRDDNPLIPQFVFLRREYDDGVKRRRKPRLITITRSPGARENYGR